MTIIFFLGTDLPVTKPEILPEMKRCAQFYSFSSNSLMMFAIIVES
jgi:hypothetical protein